MISSNWLCEMRDTRTFLRLFGDRFTFQAGADKPNAKDFVQKGRIFHGSLDDVMEGLKHYNRNHAFISFCPNETDLRGRKKENVKKIRAFWCDLDGSPLLSLSDYPITPSAVVNTSPGRFHLYWLVEGAPLSTFEEITLQLAYMLDGDQQTAKLNFALRIPGFFHMKREPYQVRLIHAGGGRTSYEQFIEAFAITLKKPVPPLPRAAQRYVDKAKPKAKASDSGRFKLVDSVRFAAPGSRHETLLRMARALANDVIAQEITEEDYRHFLSEAAQDAGLNFHEINTTLRDALNYARQVN